MTNEILVVDDNLDIRLLISSILKDKGFSVREAANFDQALNEINNLISKLSSTTKISLVIISWYCNFYFRSICNRIKCY